MNHIPEKHWALPAGCGLLQGSLAFVLLFVGNPDSSPAMRTLIHSRSLPAAMGWLAVGAAACVIATGMWTANRRRAFLLVLNGLGCCALAGMLFLGASRPVTFRSIAFLVSEMAATLALYALATAHAGSARSASRWVWSIAALIATSFTAAFLAFGLHWMRLDPEWRGQSFYWLGAYFGFSGIVMLALSLDRHGRRTPFRIGSEGALPAI